MRKKKQTFFFSFAIRLFLTWVITLKKKAFKSFENRTSSRLAVWKVGRHIPSAGLARHAGDLVGYRTRKQ